MSVKWHMGKSCSFLEIWISLRVKCTAALSFKWRNASLFPDCVLHTNCGSNRNPLLAGFRFDVPQCPVCHILSIFFSFVRTKEEPEIKARHSAMALPYSCISLPSLISRLSVQDTQPQTRGLTEGLGTRL